MYYDVKNKENSSSKEEKFKVILIKIIFKAKTRAEKKKFTLQWQFAVIIKIVTKCIDVYD